MFRSLLNFSDCTNLEEKYDKLYSIFHRDFVANKTLLANKIYVNPFLQGNSNGKEEIFWHIVTRKNRSTRSREYDEERAKRMAWVKPMIENYNHSDIKLFYYYEDNRKIRLYLWAYNYNFLVILQKTGDTESYLVTSFYIDNDRKRRSIERKYQEYISNDDNRLEECEWF